MIDACKGCGAVRSWTGMLLNDTSTLPLPESLTRRGKNSSRPVVEATERKAWCGLRAFLPLVVVRSSLSVSKE